MPGQPSRQFSLQTNSGDEIILGYSQGGDYEVVPGGMSQIMATATNPTEITADLVEKLVHALGWPDTLPGGEIVVTSKELRSFLTQHIGAKVTYVAR